MNIAIAQSGGPTCAINASLVGAFSEALKTHEIDAVFGSINGIEGIINNNLIDLKNIDNLIGLLPAFPWPCIGQRNLCSSSFNWDKGKTLSTPPTPTMPPA